VNDHNSTPAHASLARALAAGSVVVLLVAAAYLRAAAVPAACTTLAGWVVVAALVWNARARLPAAPLSLANRITLVRATLTVSLAGLAATPAWASALAWLVLGVAGVELVLDAVDGQLARRRGEASDFGARLDAEIDALFVLVLSLLAFHVGRSSGAPGAFVLAIGAFRYALLAAALPWPWLRGEVPSSLRAKIICNVAIGALLFCVAPPSPLVLRTPIAALALALLAWSFSFDVRYLLRTRRRQT
jgi:phosphatidylglycerophosphate synthase